jgi:hypothetical protein
MVMVRKFGIGGGMVMGNLRRLWIRALEAYNIWRLLRLFGDRSERVVFKG